MNKLDLESANVPNVSNVSMSIAWDSIADYEIANPKRMLCPVCKKQLVDWQQLKLDDPADYSNGEVPLRWGYHCPDVKCQTRTNGIFWNYDGELYINNLSPYFNRSEKAKIPYIDGNDAPFGTLWRKLKAETPNSDKDKLLVTFPLWFPNVLKGMKIYREYNYQSNEEGDILKCYTNLKYIREDGCYHSWGINMLIFSFKGIYREWKSVRNNPKDTFSLKRLQDYIIRKDWDKDWWRNWSSKVAYIAIWDITRRKIKENKRVGEQLGITG